MKKMSAEDAELRRAIQDNKAVMEKNRHDFDTTISDLRRKQKDELTAALAELHEKQKDELTAALTELYEKQKKEFQSSLAELRDKSIAQLEKENARIKAVLNAAVEKLNHVKFKKLLDSRNHELGQSYFAVSSFRRRNQEERSTCLSLASPARSRVYSGMQRIARRQSPHLHLQFNFAFS